MKQGIIGIVAFTVIATVIALGLMTSTQAAVVENSKSPISMTWYNDCSGEDVEFHGYIHEVYRVTDDGNGGFHIGANINYAQATGTGLSSGDHYQVSGAYADNFNLKAGEVYTSVHHGQIIRPGKEGNGLFHFTYHYTINANGEMTSYVDKFDVKCPGPG